MSNDVGKESRESAQKFGEKTEEALEKGKEAVDALRGKDEPSPAPSGDTEITITVKK